MKLKKYPMFRRGMRHVDSHVSLFLLCILLAFIASALGQLFLGVQLASEGYWQHASGWQREISIWNIFGIALILGALRNEEWEAHRFVILGIIVLTAPLGINHLGSYISSNAPWWHLVLAILNIVGAIWGSCLVLWLRYPSWPDGPNY